MPRLSLPSRAVVTAIGALAVPSVAFAGPVELPTERSPLAGADAEPPAPTTPPTPPSGSMPAEPSPPGDTLPPETPPGGTTPRPETPPGGTTPQPETTPGGTTPRPETTPGGTTPTAEPPPPESAIPSPEVGGDPLRGAAGLSPQQMVDAEKAAYERFLAGNRALERADADAAVIAYRDALATLPDEPPYGPSRGSLGLRLALACAAQYDQTGDLRWLDAERTVLRAHAGRLREIRPSDAAARERLAASVQLRLRQLAEERDRVAGDHGDWEQQIDRSLRGEYTEDRGPKWSPASEDLRWYPRPDDPRPKSRQADDGEIAPEKLVPSDGPTPGRRKGVGLVAAGAVALCAGVAGLAVMGAVMARASSANDFDPMATPDDRLAQIHRGQTGNTMAVVGLVTGSALLVTGAVLVGVGAKRMRASAPPRAAIAPFAGPSTAGLVLRGTLP